MDAEVAPPRGQAPRPLLVYDGDCGFCVRSAMRWRWRVGDAIEMQPSQAVGDRIPGVGPADYERSVVLQEPAEGRISRGAEAVFRVQAAGGRRLPLWCYQHLPGVAFLTEWGYRQVSLRRQLVSRLDRWLVGRGHLVSTFARSRALFVRALGLVAALAFLSLWVQVQGLMGSDGIVPAGELLDALRSALGGAAWTEVPTLFWLGSGDGVLHGACGLGVALGLLVALDLAPALGLLVLAALYLSLVQVGHVFLQLQWDSLLVETLLLGALYAPWRLWRGRDADPEPSAVGRLLVWWLLVRFMVESGVVKLTWGDPTWADLSAMTHHYMTQPLPHGVSWFAHHLPVWLHRTSAVAMFVVEIGLPLLVLGPRRVRHLAALGMLLLQALIAATGNYGFFNLLSALLCLSLLDDQLLAALHPSRWMKGRAGAGTGSRGGARREEVLAAPSVESAGADAVPTSEGEGADAASEADALCEVPLTLFVAPPRRPREHAVRRWLVTALALAPLSVGLLQLTDLDPTDPRAPLDEELARAGVLGALVSAGPVAAAQVLQADLRPFLAVNPYGLFRVMTTTRPEIRLEGLPPGADPEDEGAWLEYAFRYKPDGRLERTPPWVQPHMPRLDWRLWFEALSWEAQARRGAPYQRLASPWFQRFLVAVLEARPAVLALLESDPFHGVAPAAVRARLYDYRFTSGDEESASGDVWVATLLDPEGVAFRAGP